jgi:hypothetical protein
MLGGVITRRDPVAGLNLTIPQRNETPLRGTVLRVDPSGHLHVSCPFRPGMSGSPALDDSGDVVGVVIGTFLDGRAGLVAPLHVNDVPLTSRLGGFEQHEGALRTIR